MSLIFLKDHIGEWLIPSSKHYDQVMYKIISNNEFKVHHMENSTKKPYTITYDRSYDNSSGYYKLISDEEAQEILNNRKQPSPYDHVIKKIREMKARRERMGYDY